MHTHSRDLLTALLSIALVLFLGLTLVAVAAFAAVELGL